MDSGCPWLCWSCVPLPTGTLMLPLRGPMLGEGMATPSICRGPPGCPPPAGPGGGGGGAVGFSSPPDRASLPPVTQPEPPAPGPFPAPGAARGGPTHPRVPRTTPGTCLGLLPAPWACGGDRDNTVRSGRVCRQGCTVLVCAGPAGSRGAWPRSRSPSGWGRLAGGFGGDVKNIPQPLSVPKQGCKYWNSGYFCRSRCVGWEKVAEFAPGPSGGPQRSHPRCSSAGSPVGDRVVDHCTAPDLACFQRPPSWPCCLHHPQTPLLSSPRPVLPNPPAGVPGIVTVGVRLSRDRVAPCEPQSLPSSWGAG